MGDGAVGWWWVTLTAASANANDVPGWDGFASADTFSTDAPVFGQGLSWPLFATEEEMSKRDRLHKKMCEGANVRRRKNAMRTERRIPRERIHAKKSTKAERLKRTGRYESGSRRR